ncbi:MAG: TonB-dependent receptor [Rhodospirillaceae bacterium]|nr:TonB-dependent receptor [Rhodospirillaceae bacterium]MDE0360251.1 TonB-dependent receptor [Rhodospirillaceae bacterium]
MTSIEKVRVFQFKAPKRRMQKIRQFLSALVVGTGLLALSNGAVAQSVSGEITDPGRSIAFPGAIVRIEGLQGSTTSDERGRFRLGNVPAGSYTLIVSYVGTEDTTISIEVPEDGVDLGEVVIGATAQASLEEIIVFGQAAAFASALNQERSAHNLVSVLDTDAIGQFPDQNVAESLRRLTGVSVETDQGEGRYVVIRGMDPDLNSTSINGVRATAAEPRRALQLDVIPTDLLDGLEVHKTLTPDMDADAIGGSINVKTLSAFSRKGAYAKARAESSFNERREEWGPKLSFAGSNIFDLEGDRRLGIAGALSWHDRGIQADNNEADDWDEADNGSYFMEEFQPRLYLIERERLGGALNFDLDVSDSTTLHLYTLYSRFTDTELRNRLTFGLDGLDEDTVTATTADYSEVEIERDTKGRNMQGQVAENRSISLGSETQLDSWLVETNLGYSYAREQTPDQVSGTWVAEFASGDGPIPDGQPVLTIDRSNPQIPLVRSNFFSVLQDPSLYELDEIEHFVERNEDTQVSLKFDATRDTGFGSLKFGAKGRWREKTSDETATFWSNDDAWFLSDALLPGGADTYGFPNEVGPVPDSRLERQILAAETGLEFEPLDTDLDSAVADFTINEDVLAVYFMGTWETDRATLVAGLRYEHTNLDSRGNEVELIEEDQHGPGDPPDDTLIVTPVQATQSYGDLLPSANLRFNFSENVVGRASVYRSVVRPRVEDVAFRVAIEGDEAELGNPALDPYRAWNLDASIAFYPTELSVVSGGVFHKRIEDFIFIQTLDDYAFQNQVFDEAVIALNGEVATALGLEFTYQQHFGFLAAPFDGFLASLNFTVVDSEGNTGDRAVGLPKQSANIGGITLGYDKFGLDVRLAVKYRDSYIDELIEPGLDRYTDDRLQWDLTAKYGFSENWQIYAEVANLGDAPEFYYAGNRRRVLQYDLFGTTSSVGFQYNFQ